MTPNQIKLLTLFVSQAVWGADKDFGNTYHTKRTILIPEDAQWVKHYKEPGNSRFIQSGLLMSLLREARA